MAIPGWSEPTRLNPPPEMKEKMLEMMRLQPAGAAAAD
jgi:hypothetical protein